MKIRRLGWAGVELEMAGGRAVIDLLGDLGSMRRFLGEPHEALPVPAPESITVALVTHLHSDHADPTALQDALAPGGVVLRPATAAGSGLETAGTRVAEEGFERAQITTRVLDAWQSTEIGPFRISAVPAADGFGDPQLSWVISTDDATIFHAGDTLFHGWWWLTRMRLGPIDVAFLPINGPIVDLPHRQPQSNLPAAMDPSQAAEAAALLEADQAVPIHYDTLHRAPIYTQVDAPAEAFAATAALRGVNATVLAPGEELHPAATASTGREHGHT